MNNLIDTSSVIPSSEIKGDSDEESRLLREMAIKAQAFIESFEWCNGVENSYFGFGVGGIVGVFFILFTPMKT
jgi:hypothetical protein